MRETLAIAGLLLVLPGCKTETKTPEPPAVTAPATPPAPSAQAAPAATPAVGDGALTQGDCAINADTLRGKEGESFRVSCPAGCEKAGHEAYGTDVYTSDTPICKAGVHAGAIAEKGGIVSGRIEPGRPAYRGKDQHGVKSLDYTKHRRSFSVITAESAARPASDPSLIEAGCSYGGGQLAGPDGTTFRIACPPGCEKGGHGIYGTDVYTTDSPICKAAIHAGAIRPEGGSVTVRVEPGRPAYAGSNQNGVSSRSYGKYKKSYAVVVP